MVAYSFKKRFADWTKTRSEAGETLRAVIDNDKEREGAQRRIQELYQQRTRFMKEDMAADSPRSCLHSPKLSLWIRSTRSFSTCALSATIVPGLPVN